MNEPGKHIIVEVHEGVARLTLDRPPVNVLNIAMLNELNRALKRFIDMPIKLLIITGKGRAFCAGVDVAEHLPDKAEQMLSTFHKTFDLLASIEAPTLAAVNGAALGGGCELATFCDFVIAGENAKFGQPEIRLGTLPPVAAALLPRLCGPRKAMELILTGMTIDAPTAEKFGLVNRVVADDQLSAEVKVFSDELTALSAAAIRRAKRAVLSGLNQSFAGAFDSADAECLDTLLRAADAREGLRAFLEKRQPVWTDA
ncbi:MAG TPA: enoyl-CoA hydratase/isomerase family protein [Blastocatellia bacterium]|nr:enoyl-CoA hydratase/isomerase family protein [Blastocatellia bacterium]